MILMNLHTNVASYSNHCPKILDLFVLILKDVEEGIKN